MKDFREMPIALGINPHTGNKEGDDSGYRSVLVSSEDQLHPDELVPLDYYGFIVRPLYSTGVEIGLCPYYGSGIGGPNRILVRLPVAHGLVDARTELARFGKNLMVLDGFRPAQTQAKLWASIYQQIAISEGKDPDNLSYADEVRIGLLADAVGSYYPPLHDDTYNMLEYRFLRSGLMIDAAAVLGMGVGEFVGLYLAFEANLGHGGLTFDLNQQTAHGGGGAIDLWTMGLNTGRYSNFGVPFDYVASPSCSRTPAQMDYFDLPDFDIDAYATEVEASSALKQYLSELGHNKVTLKLCKEIRQERRILFHVMASLGASFYNGECWHYQFGNERGGNQCDTHEGYGNTCHAVLCGHKEAIWGNASGHRLGRKLGVF